ncbi:ras and EF-hand domain-containing protein homolog isoform X2 [Ornithodoros turicata]|uniref:ras and EF-hand domain-containing protein homolog isoform X2 n=1 Tax=Ornithodoros turicata TaxID=34597 RepID=UPI00313904D4
MATLQLEQLFKACDTSGTGFLDQEELRKLCSRFSITSQDADAIFEDLDHDRDGKIDFNDFKQGFSDFLTQYPGTCGDTPSPSRSSSVEEATDRRESVTDVGQLGDKVWTTHKAWQNLTTELAKAGNMINQESLNALYKELQKTDRPQVVERFEDVIADLLDNMKRLQEENCQLESTWLREKKEHESHLRRMEEEMDSQVKIMEQQAKEKAQEEAEAQRKNLQARMSEEMDELQSHVSLFEKVEKWLRANESHDKKLTSVHSKLDEALQENRQLRLSLMDTQSNVALTRSELAQIRTQYENKCKQLYDERDKIMNVLQEQGFVTRQLQHLQDANKRLQDTNDILRSVLEKAEKMSPQQVPRRESILSDYFGQDFLSPRAPSRSLRDRPHFLDPDEEERASAIWSKGGSPPSPVMTNELPLAPVSEGTEADQPGLAEMAPLSSLDEPEDGNSLTFKPRIVHETLGQRRRSSTSSSLSSPVQTLEAATPEDEVQPEPTMVTVPVQTRASATPPPTAPRTKRPSVTERGTESLPVALGESVSPDLSISASSESGIGSRNTWCSVSEVNVGNVARGSLRGDDSCRQLESVEASPQATPSRAALSSRRISEIKRQLGVDPTTARYHRTASPVDIFRRPSNPNVAAYTRRQRSLSPQKPVSLPVPLPRTRSIPQEPATRPRKHLSRQLASSPSCDDVFVKEEVSASSEPPTPVPRKMSRRSSSQPTMSDSGSPKATEATGEVFGFCSGPPEQTFKVVFVGDASVGKSSFIMRLSKGIFLPQLTSTLGVDFQTKNVSIDEKNICLQLWDTAGQERFRCITQSYFRKADGVMLMYDCTNEQSFVHVRQWANDLEEAASRGVPIMLVCNKTDLREWALSQGNTVISREEGEKIAEEIKAIFIETSAKDGSNIQEAVASLTRAMIAKSIPRESGDVQLAQTPSKSKCCNK